MESRRQWCFPSLFLLGSVFLVCSDARVFRPAAHASTVFLRSKRANSFLLEEILQGNLERECYEEKCTYEEAREYFEDTSRTNSFWTVYKDGDQCMPNPCLHGGSCKDGIGGYTCNCTESHHGLSCELDISQCPVNGPSSCEHFCSPTFSSYECSCAVGYRIHSDKRSCVPAVKHPCGRLQPTNQKGVVHQVCPDNRCPWQVVFLNESGAELCSGVILGPHSVLTSAICLYEENRIHIMQIGNLNISMKDPAPAQLYIHNRHKKGSLEDDLALVSLHQHIVFGPSVTHLCLPKKDFSENVLMLPEREGMTRGPDKRRGDSHGPPMLTYMRVDDCRPQVNVTLTNKMFCMRRKPAFCGTGVTRFNENCSLIPGSAVATEKGRTVFLTGLLLLASRTHDCDQALVFTKLSRYLPWIQQTLDKAEKEDRTKPQMIQHLPLP
ncbi:hypothetical protein UPYG_G00021870 [Umbra pygmaea]|uniref:Uncharacterized protein n=1 Tax=Umbra pygmaea TaxID=75934 RepID=A0ABD0XKY3_UMBPY